MIKSVLTCTTLIISCPALAAPDQNYDPSKEARIRLFGQNGKPTLMVSDIDCETRPKGKKVNVGGGVSDAFKSFTGTASNQTLGIPETQASKSLKEMNGILSKAFFKEYAITAGQPVNVSGALIGTSVQTPSQTMYVKGCSSTVSFTPQAGHDYEVLGQLNGRKCTVIVKEVVQQNNQTIYQDVVTSDVFKCKK
ncbi:UNVERIFIED_CONTAM: hypothetical protein GN151_06085 [Acinetobacter sp. HSTU-ASm16]